MSLRADVAMQLVQMRMGLQYLGLMPTANSGITAMVERPFETLGEI